ncbi:HAMP domain-containing sensor histidine kinase [Clostridium cavendishii]|uniref:HAMP domain-containing sensor histidine kinase n=1 Tax=Clostridium cavendishii TaxID=349931 RepID=UPI001A9A500E|nr:HAMP domain-containing sensor histidine kinase [Clostridium cavendishii]
MGNFIFKNKVLNYSGGIDSIYNKDFSKIDISILEEIGGWIEILDENKKVIYVKGEKRDKVTQYSEKDLFELTALFVRKTDSKEHDYIGELSFVEGKNGEQYILIMKFDRKKMSPSMTYKPSLGYKKDIPFVLKTYGVMGLFIVLYLLIGLYIYSKISSKFITTPLKNFIAGIKKIKRCDYDVRTNVQGLKEMQEVEAEFNEMAMKLKEVTEENKRIDESKKRLLVDISHDLKTPITSIQGFSKLLLEENITEEEREKFLKIIYNKSIYSTLLIEDLFQMSKLEDAEYNIDLKEDNFSEWLRRLIIEYYEEFRNRSLNLDIDITEKPIIFRFDGNLMRRAISNILNNSLKHNKPNTTIAISCYLEEENVILKFGDDGDAIESPIRDKIFEPFVKSEMKKSEGSGLGLAITKKIIEKHGGKIELTSTDKEKNLFNICIPLKF